MTEDKLSELLNQAVPPLGPALSPEGVLTAARRRQQRRRSYAVTGAMGVAAVGAFGLVEAGKTQPSPSRPGPVLAAPSPCISPYANSEGEPTATFPDDGSTQTVALTVGQHVTVAWAACKETGQITGGGEGTALQLTDASSEGKGGATINLRFLAVTPGEVLLSGKGTEGSHGTIAVDVLPVSSGPGHPSPTSAPPTATPPTATPPTGAPSTTVTATTTPPALVPVDQGGPTAGSCAEQVGDLATVVLNPDTPSPRCTKVRVGQKLRITNGTDNFSQVGETITITLRGFAPRTLAPGESYTFPTPLSEVLAPGYHRTSGGPHGDAEMIVEG